MSGEIDEAQLQKVIDELLRQRCNSGEEHQYHVDQTRNYVKSDIVWESRKERLNLLTSKKKALVVHSCQRDLKAPPMTLLNQDLFYLKHGNSGLKKYILSLHKYHVVLFLDDDIEERTSRTTYELGHEHKFIIKIIVRRANGKIDLFTELDYKYLNKKDTKDIYLLCINDKVKDYRETSYQHNVNLTAPKITFSRIEKEELFTITCEPVRVLEGLEKYNKDVKYGYVDLSPSDADDEYLRFYKEDIRECLKHRDQMRRWDMYVSGKPLRSRRDRLE
ncbi:hypothetical protein Tco_0828544 [Tanacetum coccineum]